jgi:hypothetical protein
MALSVRYMHFAFEDRGHTHECSAHSWSLRALVSDCVCKVLLLHMPVKTEVSFGPHEDISKP